MAFRRLTSLAGKAMHTATLLLVALAASPAGSASANPFEKLAGDWYGGGTVNPLKGKPERVSCRATYKVEGAAVAQNLRCAGADYKFDATSNLTYQGGTISGSWNEDNHEAAGDLSGTASGNSVRARISGDKFSGRVSINVSGSRHTISIVQYDMGSGAYRPVASVSLHR
jgi:hypothetical protein